MGNLIFHLQDADASTWISGKPRASVVHLVTSNTRLIDLDGCI